MACVMRRAGRPHTRRDAAEGSAVVLHLQLLQLLPYPSPRTPSPRLACAALRPSRPTPCTRCIDHHAAAALLHLLELSLLGALSSANSANLGVAGAEAAATLVRLRGAQVALTSSARKSGPDERSLFDHRCCSWACWLLWASRDRLERASFRRAATLPTLMIMHAPTTAAPSPAAVWARFASHHRRQLLQPSVLEIAGQP